MSDGVGATTASKPGQITRAPRTSTSSTRKISPTSPPHRVEAVLVVVELLAGLGRELEIRPFDDGVDRAGLLAQAAVDALHHVDVVARGAAGAVIAARAGLDGDRLGRTDRLAQLAGDAAL